ncbi:MAG TPA: C39 family peptidase [Bryobacteraceae bacterium]|nr:C39 family peptidase [Bryobacteraceae bacterium]
MRRKLAGVALHGPIRASSALLLAAVSICFAASDASEWLDVPYVRQSEEGCGAASIAMVMQYWLRQNSHLDAAASDASYIYKVLPRSNDGISGQALKNYLEQHGFSAFLFGGELKDLRHHLEKGRPVVVCLAPKGAGKALHYVVVAGISGSRVFLNDPVRGRLIQEGIGEFQREWKAAGNWSLLAVPRP